MHNILGQSAFWIVNKKLSSILGLEEAVFLSDLIGKHEFFKQRNQLMRGGYFFNTVDMIEKDTGLSYRKQKRVIDNLKESNTISTKRLGSPSKLYFKINYGAIKSILKMTSLKNDSDKPIVVPVKKIVVYKDNFNSLDELKNAVNEIYRLYPATCPTKKTSTGKAYSNKEKIKYLLRFNSKHELIDIIKWYVKECKTNKIWLKNFNTFLNNLPEIPKEELVNSNDKEIKKLVKWLSSNYMMKQPDDKARKVVDRLIELEYSNKEFLNQFI